MASWKKYFSAVPTHSRLNQRLDSGQPNNHGTSTSGKSSSYLPEVYSGAPNRIERYTQYEQMDSDGEINKSLDIIADYSTQNYEQGDSPFDITYNDNMSETEIKILKSMMKQWCSLNKWQQRLWRLFRNTIKYGDQIYIRDPETFKLIWIDPTKVEKIIVSESKGKDIEQYVMRDIDFNLSSLVGSNMLVHDQYSFPGGYPGSSNPAARSGATNYSAGSSPGSRTSRFNMPQNQHAIDATHVVHFSLSEGMDSQWPFGTSLLEPIYKVYKQKDLLEDSILIYRIVRAPERRVFYIDTGGLSGPRAQSVVERMKNEVYQRRIPNSSSNGQNPILDASYSPLCLALDTKIPLLDGRVLTLTDIIAEFEQGKKNWIYSCDPVTGEVVPGDVSWAGITKRNTETIKITLDTGESFVCTPSHKIPVFDRGFVEAKDLTIHDKLISFTHTISVDYKNNQKLIWDHKYKKWIYLNDDVEDFYKNKNTDSRFRDNVNSLNTHATIIDIVDHINIDVGTMTVDGLEKYHDYHTFAIEAGIFVKNSINEDYFLATNSEGKGTRIETLPGGDNLGSVSLDTKCKLLDGRNLSILEIEEEMKNGKTLWTYSCHPVTGAILPGKISWAGKTKSNAQVMKLTLDNDESIICTLDHEFPIIGRGFIEAQNLTVGQSLIGSYTRNEPISEYKKLDYTQYYDHSTKKWEYTHRMVAKSLKDLEVLSKTYIHHGSFNTIHHIDHNRDNNDPSNLIWMNWKDHKIYHADQGFSEEMQKLGTKAAKDRMNWLKENDFVEYRRIIDSITNNRKKWWSNLSDEQKMKVTLNKKEAILKYFASLTKEKKLKRAEISKKNGSFNKTYFSLSLYNKLVDIFSKNKNLKKEDIYSVISNDVIFMREFIQLNSHKIINSFTHTEMVSFYRNYKITSTEFDRICDHKYDCHIEQKFIYTDVMLSLLTEKFLKGNRTLESISYALNCDVEFISHWKEINSTSHNNSKFNTIQNRHIHRILNFYGLTWNKFKILNTNINPSKFDTNFYDYLKLVSNSSSQKEFIKKTDIPLYKFMKIAKGHGFNDFSMIKEYCEIKNHRIINIEYLDQPIDVGCINVDRDETYHNYHTFALSCGVFIKNSIDDLKYFSNKMVRGLGIPSSYLPTGPDDSITTYNDGKVGTAYVQEFRFAKFCQRLQNHLSPVLDREFKLYLKDRGIEIESNAFELQFWPPQNFAQYKQMAVDSEQIAVFSSLMSTDAAKYISKRTALKRYLGWNDSDILDNEESWKQENPKKVKDTTGVTVGDQDQPDLRGVGIRPEPDESIDNDLNNDFGDDTGGDTGGAGADTTGTDTGSEPTT